MGTVYVVAVELSSGGTRAEHIVSIMWVAPTFKSGLNSTEEIIGYMDQGNSVKVSDGETVADVEVVRPQGRRPYIRSASDKTDADNLLALPRYVLPKY